MRREVIPDQLAVFHYEADTFQFVNVRNGISRDGHEIGEERDEGNQLGPGHGQVRPELQHGADNVSQEIRAI